jgi:hypothetical protein
VFDSCRLSRVGSASGRCTVFWAQPLSLKDGLGHAWQNSLGRT